MTVIYQSNFDALADGVISDFIDPNGSPFSVAVGTTGNLPTSGTKVYRASSVGDSCVYTPPGATSNQAVRFTQKISAMAAGDNQNAIGAILRSTTTTQAAYRLYFLGNAGGTALIARIVKYTGGSTTLATSGDLFSASTSDVIHLEASAVGTTSTVLELRIWKNSDARPSSPTLTYTDTSTPHQTGYAGVRKHGVFAFTGCDDFVITDASGGEDYFYPPSMELNSAASASAVATANLTTSIQLSATATGVATATAALADNGMGAIAVSVASATAALTTAIRLTANATSVASATAALTTFPVGRFTTEQLVNNTDTPLANQTGVVVNVYNATTGALVVRKTGLTSDATGFVEVADALIVAGTTYSFEVVLTSLGRRLPTALAT